MKTFQQFLEEMNGDYVEVAGSANANNQCVDLANAYIRDVLGLPIIKWTNAIDFPSRAGDRYTYIKNTPSGVPQSGDLVIWGAPYGRYVDANGKVVYAGHIAIFIDGNADKFRSLDQNYPSGSNIHVQEHNYTGVLGWLRAKDHQSPELTECLRQHAEMVPKLAAIDGFRKAISRALFNDEHHEWQSIYDEVNWLIRETDETRRTARVGDELWNALSRETGLETVKYEDKSLNSLLVALQGLRNTPPEGKVIVDKIEYENLEHKVNTKLTQYTLIDLMPVVMKRLGEYLYGVVRRAKATHQ